MRNIALAALATALPAVASQAQTVDICDRTQQVRDAILRAVDADDCAAVDSEGLAGVEILDLQLKRLTALRAEDFDGLTGLRIILDFGTGIAMPFKPNHLPAHQDVAHPDLFVELNPRRGRRIVAAVPTWG